MDIVSACDDNYVPHFSAMLHSASLFDPDATFWLLANGISETNRKILAAFATSLGIRLEIVPIVQADLAGLEESKRFPLASYARLLIPALLPPLIARAVYLDVDITVTASLAPLFSLDMQGFAVAASPDGPRISKLERSRLALPPETAYVNTGVLLMDLAAWRREPIADRILDYSRRTPGLTLQDQSAFNVVMADRVLVLPQRWNLMDPTQWQDANPLAIIHYAGYRKPWLDPFSPFANLDWLHRSRTPFPRARPARWSLKHLRRLIGARLGHRRYRDYARESEFDRLIEREITRPALAMAQRLLAIRDGKAA